MTALVPTVRPRGWELGAARGRIVALIAAGGFLLVSAGVIYGPRTIRCSFGSDPESKAVRSVKMFAFEAFPSWGLAHHDRRCPEQLEELLEWMNNKDITDPWGRDYRFRCTSGALRTSFVVWSAGPDRQHGTDDDIRSDSP